MINHKQEDKPMSIEEVATVAATIKRIKHFTINLEPRDVVRMSKEFKMGECFIRHQFSKNDYEHNLKVILLQPVSGGNSDEYSVVAEDYGMTH